jgi:hypothetical protein
VPLSDSIVLYPLPSVSRPADWFGILPFRTMNNQQSLVQAHMGAPGSHAAPRQSALRDSDSEAGTCPQHAGRPMTPLAGADTPVSGGVYGRFQPKNAFSASVTLCGTVPSQFTILCLADFYHRNHPCPQAHARFQKHLRIRVFGWANWWGNQDHKHGNNLRKLLAILTGCYLWPPRAVADETGGTLVRHKKTTTQNAI